jgi:hypothetical protein
MDTGLYRIERTGLAGLAGLAGLVGLAAISGGFAGDPEQAKPDRTVARALRVGLVWLPVAVMTGFGAWMLLSGYSSKPAESEPTSLATAVTPGTAQSPATDVTLDGSMVNPAATAEELTAAAEMSPVNGLKISSQSWRRGGLGSKALVTFTLRNGNDYAVKDIEISCAFSRRDGSHLTDRRRMIHEAVKTKGRKTFARVHVGFVNVNAGRAKCALVTASRE